MARLFAQPKLSKLRKLQRRGIEPLDSARLVVGLGNPGADYSGHRHNAGLRAARELARLLSMPQPTRERHYRVAQRVTPYGNVAVALPRTFMNESGKAVQALLDRYRAEPSSLILLVDELDLPPGRIRVRPNGSDAGQRGMRSIRSLIGELDFPRIRIGVGRPVIDGKPSRHPNDVADWLLSDPSPADARLIRAAELRAAETVIHILAHDVDSAMNLYNQSSPPSSVK